MVKRDRLSASVGLDFYARKQLLLSAHLSIRLSVHPSVTQVDQSKMVLARIKKFFTIGCPEDSGFRNRKAFPKI